MFYGRLTRVSDTTEVGLSDAWVVGRIRDECHNMVIWNIALDQLALVFSSFVSTAIVTCINIGA